MQWFHPVWVPRNSTSGKLITDQSTSCTMRGDHQSHHTLIFLTQQHKHTHHPFPAPPLTPCCSSHPPLLLLRHPAVLPPQPLSITLKGITNDHVDPSIDTWRTVTLPLIRRAAGLEESAAVECKIIRRGARPGGGGEVQLRVPLIKQLPRLDMTDEGMVKRIRGIAYSSRVGLAGRGVVQTQWCRTVSVQC